MEFHTNYKNKFLKYEKQYDQKEDPARCGYSHIRNISSNLNANLFLLWIGNTVRLNKTNTGITV
jgi:hypothetical protein